MAVVIASIVSVLVIDQDLNALDLPFRYDDCRYTVDFGFDAFPTEFNWEPSRSQENDHRDQALQAFLDRRSPWH